MPVDPEKRQAFHQYLAKEHKDEDVVYNYRGPAFRIPFLSPMLTWATTGGLPVGHIGRWFGPEGSGKSLTNWGLIYCAMNYPEVMSEIMEIDYKWLESNGNKFIAKALKNEMSKAIKAFPNGMECIIFDTEQRADTEFAERLGIDVKRLEIIDNNVIEEIIKDATHALDAFHIVIIDSASNAQSVMSENLEPGQYDRGSDAQAWKRLRQLRRKLDRTLHSVIIVDQVRTSPEAMQGTSRHAKPTQPAGGRFLKHNASLTIEYAAGRPLYLDKDLELTDDYDKASRDIPVLGTDGKEEHGIEMRCKVIKNSTGRPRRNARMRFMFPVADSRTGELIQDVGFDESFELAEIALYFGMIEKSGAWYYILDEDYESTGDKYQGKSKLGEALSDDDELRDRILGRLYADQQPPPIKS